MTNNFNEQQLKLFAISNQLVENDLDRIEHQYAIDLGRNHQGTITSDHDYYPQIELNIRKEACQMAKSYEIFFSLEKTIRAFVSDTLGSAESNDWWNGDRVPQKVKQDSEDRMRREIDTGVTPRSEEPLDYTTFGELGEIIKSNWDVFGGIFRSKKAVENVLSRLNTLRGPIAHCSLLAEDEIVRLNLSVRDWFRLMG